MKKLSLAVISALVAALLFGCAPLDTPSPSAASAAPLDANALLRHVRTLRGSAQMAREEHVHAVARRLEAVARGLVDRRIQWTADLARRVAETVSDLRALANGSEGDDAARARVRQDDEDLIAAMRRGSAVDYASRLFSVAGVSMPVFWLGMT